MSLLKYSGKSFIYKILPVFISGGDYLSQGEIVNLRGRHIHTQYLYAYAIDVLLSLAVCYSDCKFISFMYVFVIIKKGEIVRTRSVLIKILSFDDNKHMNFV